MRATVPRYTYRCKSQIEKENKINGVLHSSSIGIGGIGRSRSIGGGGDTNRCLLPFGVLHTRIDTVTVTEQ